MLNLYGNFNIKQAKVLYNEKPTEGKNKVVY